MKSGRSLQITTSQGEPLVVIVKIDPHPQGVDLFSYGESDRTDIATQSKNPRTPYRPHRRHDITRKGLRSDLGSLNV
jgi:hypothetical protein